MAVHNQKSQMKKRVGTCKKVEMKQMATAVSTLSPVEKECLTAVLAYKQKKHPAIECLNSPGMLFFGSVAALTILIPFSGASFYAFLVQGVILMCKLLVVRTAVTSSVHGAKKLIIKINGKEIS